MAAGRCLCGTVRWEAGGDLTPLSHCHCSMCRKAHGAPFATFTTSAIEDFRWLAGEDAIGTYEASPDLGRAFCRTCGSALPGLSAAAGEVYLPTGSMDEVDMTGGHHIFAASRACWHTIADDLPQSEAWSGAEGDLPVFADRVLDAPKAGVLRGSCLCNKISFEIDEPFMMVMNCHCSRCRHARSAAHTTNGFVPLEALRFLRGEELVTDYALPGAEVFGQAFCASCGSGMPRRTPARGRVNVPMGALDDPTDARPAAHIFVAFKAPWYEIADALPQHDAMPG